MGEGGEDTGVLFSGVFGGTIANGSTYTFPSGVESWAGFAADAATADYPYAFPAGGTIEFTGSSDAAVDLYFKFEKAPFPDTEPSFATATVTVDGGAMEYSVEIPAQDAGNTYASFLLYLTTQDTPVTLTNVTVTANEYSGPVLGCTDETATNFDAAAEEDNGSCIYTVTFALDLNCSDLDTSGGVFLNGSFNNWCGNCWAMQDDDQDGIWEMTETFGLGDIEYKFTVGSSWEDVAGAGDCTISVNDGEFINRVLTVDGNITLDPVAYGSCEGCPVSTEGGEATTEEGGEATTEEGGEATTEEGGEGGTTTTSLFFSEAAEGSGDNKYLEIYNPTGETAFLANYQLAYCTNGCDVDGEFDNFFDLGNGDVQELAAGDVFVVCHSGAAPLIKSECDLEFGSLSNGDDVFALFSAVTGEAIDILGTPVGGDPGGGFTLCGTSEATKDQTLVRNCDVTSGTTAYSPDACEWSINDKDDWLNVGVHCD